MIIHKVIEQTFFIITLVFIDSFVIKLFSQVHEFNMREIKDAQKFVLLEFKDT